MRSDSKGVTESAHLEQVAKQLGHRPKELEAPKFPFPMAHVWSSFFSISGGRQFGYSGPQPLTFTGIKAWQETTDNTLEGWEVDVIKKLDLLYVRAING